MIDAPDVIRDFLVDQGTLTAVTGTRIWAEVPTPPPGYTPADGPGIAFMIRGGVVDYTGAVLIPSCQFKCYGEDEATAQSGYRALFDVLHEQRGEDIKFALMERPGQTLREPTNWVFVLAYYTIFVSNP